eukprot:1337505-Rhodomonas_salina.1
MNPKHQPPTPSFFTLNPEPEAPPTSIAPNPRPLTLTLKPPHPNPLHPWSAPPLPQPLNPLRTCGQAACCASTAAA